MCEYIKKPIPVKATQWWKNGDHPEDDVFRVFEDTRKVPTTPREGAIVRYYRSPWGGDGNEFCQWCNNPMHIHGWIDTLEGGHIVCPGDWILTGIHGEYWAVKPDIFEESYYKV